MKKRIIRAISFTVSLIMVFCMLPANVFALEFANYESVRVSEPSLNLSASTYSELVSAINQANTSGGAVITLTADITVTAAFPNITADVVIKGAHHTLLCANDYIGGFFTVNAGATLTLDGGVIIDGNNEWVFNESLYAEKKVGYLKGNKVTGILDLDLVDLEADAPIATEHIFTVNGNVVVNDATVQNHVGYTYDAGNNIGYGIFLMKDNSELVINNNSKLIHNASEGGSIIAYVEGTGAQVVINGGLIDDNYIAGDGGIFRNERGYIEMNGGTISNNRGHQSNGTVVYMESNYSPKFVMNGGTICSNESLYTASSGNNSPVEISLGNATAEIHGGKICHNTGRQGGGVIARNSTQLTLIITGGEFVHNFSSKDFGNTGDLAVNNVINEDGSSSTISITGGIFTQNLQQNYVNYMADNVKTSDTYGKTYGSRVVFKSENGVDVPYFYIEPDMVRNESTGETFASFQEAVDAAQAGDVITALCDQELVNSPLMVDKNITIDLGGYTLYGWKYTATNVEYSMDVMILIGADDVTFKNGTINSALMDGTTGDTTIFMVGDTVGGQNGAYKCKGNLTIENGTYISRSNIATASDGNLTIEGGYFDIQNPKNGVYGLDCVNNSYTSGKASVSVSGGTFKNFDPEENGAEGENTDFCAQGWVTTQLSADTWQIVPPVCWNMQTGKHYETVAEGLSKANEGETVQLLVSTQEGDLQLLPGTKLDINGLTLVADNVVGVDTTHVYDGTNIAENGYRANGLLRVLGNLVLDNDNCAVPVYSPVGDGYIFVDFLFNQGQDRFGDVSRVNALVTSRTTKIITLLKDGASDNDIQIGVRLTVNGEDSTTKDGTTFVFTDVTIKNVMNSNGGKFNLFDRMFYANFTGIDDFTSVIAEPIVIAHGTVIDSHNNVIVLK